MSDVLKTPPGVGPLPQAWPRAPTQVERPRRASGVSKAQISDVLAAAGAAAAIALTLRLLLDWSDLVGTILWGYAIFLVVLFLLVRDGESQQVASDRLATVFIWSIGAVVVGVLGWMIAFVVVEGFGKLRPGFFTDDLSDVGPLNVDVGGALHAIIGTLEQVGLATAVVVPIAILTAVYLHEIKGRLAPVIRFIVDAMSGLPSIVAGLLVYTLWVRSHDFSGVAAAAALAVLMLPTVTRASEEILRTVPDSLREGSLALGAPQWRVVQRIILPTATAGLITAVILGIARAIGETAVVLLTALGSDRVNADVLNGAQSNLPLFVYKLYRLPNATQQARAFTGALVLVMLVLFLFLLARYVGGRSARRLGRTR